jgi:hypothetical protein
MHSADEFDNGSMTLSLSEGSEVKARANTSALGWRRPPGLVNI